MVDTDLATVPDFTSDYGILDVMRGRVKLASHLKKHGHVRVMIEAELTEPYGYNDGTSIEFNMNVLSVKPCPPQATGSEPSQGGE